MGVATIEAFVENGQIKLPPHLHLPEHAKVYVVIPDTPVSANPNRIASPRLAKPEQASHFDKDMTQETW